MEIPNEVLDMGLKPNEFYLFAIMNRMADSNGGVDATMDTLGIATGLSRTTLWRDMSVLEAKGLLTINRTKRNLGKLHKNNYRLISPCFKNEHEGVDTAPNSVVPCFTDATSTADSNTVIVTTGTDKTIIKNTSYSFGAKAPMEGKMVNRWNDDDDIAGVGLLEGELPAAQKQAKTKAHRSERPTESWTAQMVASEFASRVYAKIPGVPGMVNTKRLSIALATNRKKYGTTAAVEIAAMDKFFSDARNVATLRKFPKNTHGVFLNAITNFVAEQSSVAVVETKMDEVIKASDGTEFDNSMPGRAALERYEEKLRRA